MKAIQHQTIGVVTRCSILHLRPELRYQGLETSESPKNLELLLLVAENTLRLMNQAQGAYGEGDH